MSQADWVFQKRKKKKQQPIEKNEKNILMQTADESKASAMWPTMNLSVGHFIAFTLETIKGPRKGPQKSPPKGQRKGYLTEHHLARWSLIFVI